VIRDDEPTKRLDDIDPDLNQELLLLARSQSWRGPLPPPQSIRQYGEIDHRYAEAILDVFKSQSTMDEKDAAAMAFLTVLFAPSLEAVTRA